MCEDDTKLFAILADDFAFGLYPDCAAGLPDEPHENTVNVRSLRHCKVDRNDQWKLIYYTLYIELCVREKSFFLRRS